jgi:ribosomal 50S subunit-recycling heat shock protein
MSGSDELFERWRCEVDKGQAQVRIDKYLAEHMSDTSRTRIQQAADSGHVWVNGKAVSSSYKVKPLDLIQVLLDHEPHDTTILPENIPLTIVYEYEDVLIVNKPAGMVVHPGHGNYEHTLLNALAYYFGQQSTANGQQLLNTERVEISFRTAEDIQIGIFTDALHACMVSKLPEDPRLCSFGTDHIIVCHPERITVKRRIVKMTFAEL